MINRIKEIKKKGFSMSLSDDTQDIYSNDQNGVLDFSKIKVGVKTLDDAILDLGLYGKIKSNGRSWNKARNN